MSQTKSSDLFCKLMWVGSSAWGGSGKIPGEWRAAPLSSTPHPPTALPRQCYEHTQVYKKVNRFCLARHLWTSLYIVHSYGLEWNYKTLLREEVDLKRMHYFILPSTYPDPALHSEYQQYTPAKLRCASLLYHFARLLPRLLYSTYIWCNG